MFTPSTAFSIGALAFFLKQKNFKKVQK